MHWPDKKKSLREKRRHLALSTAIFWARSVATSLASSVESQVHVPLTPLGMDSGIVLNLGGLDFKALSNNGLVERRASWAPVARWLLWHGGIYVTNVTNLMSVVPLVSACIGTERNDTCRETEYRKQKLLRPVSVLHRSFWKRKTAILETVGTPNAPNFWRFRKLPVSRFTQRFLSSLWLLNGLLFRQILRYNTVIIQVHHFELKYNCSTNVRKQ